MVSSSQRGTVILVSLCFVAVLGIMLAGYLALCSRVMTLSNRSFQTDLSKQLAEAGIEEALRAFNKNDWSDWSSAGMDVNWTLDTTNKRATATLSYPAGKFGQGVSAEVKIRVDNYDGHVLSATWNSTRSYRTNEVVGYNGTWYRCVLENSNKTPSATSVYWIQEQSPIDFAWNAGTTYATERLIYHKGNWYRCISSHSNQEPPNASYWTYIPGITVWTSTSYATEAVVNYLGNWYRWTGSAWDSSPAISWRWRSGYSYSVGDVVCYGSTTRWYRCIVATSSQLPTNTSYWTDTQTSAGMATTNAMFNWSSTSINYNRGDVVYYGTTGLWYRCLLGHTSSASVNPSNATYWTSSPLLSMAWTSTKQYSANDLVSYNGVWYLSLSGSGNIGQNPATATSYWIGANTSNSSYRWNSTTAYAAGAYRAYGGVWYKCLVANTGRATGDTGYWTAAWSQSDGVTTGAPVVYAQAILTMGDGTTSRTQLRAPIAPAPLFPNAVAASGTLTISAAGGTIDSYDSITDPTAGTRGYSAVVAAAGSTTGALSISADTTIKGYAAARSSTSAPYAPLVSFSSGTTVKSATSSPSPNVDTARVSRSPYVPNFDTWPRPSLSTAFSSWNFPYGNNLSSILSATTDIGIPGATTPIRYYFNGSLNIGTGYTCQTLNINGPVILYVNGTLRVRLGGAINVNSAATAEFHVDGGIREDASTTGFNNRTQDPKKMLVVSDISSTTAHRLESTTNAFYGVIYAPNTAATVGLDIRNGKDIYGAISAQEITFTNAANVHYDTSLRYATFRGMDQPYTATEWRELDAAEWATMP